MSQQPPHRRTEQGDDRREPTRQRPSQPPQYISRQPPQQQQQPPQQQQRQAAQQRSPLQARASRIRKIEQGDEYVHVRFRNPDDFEMIRTPDWAARATQDIAPGAEVRTGKLTGSGEWRTESVLVPAPVDGQTAARLATQIVEKIGE